MNAIRTSAILPLAALSLATLGFATPANALSNRAWVSGHGVDAAGGGSPASPCRSFQYVHDSIIAAGGEIDVLDPAGYGAVTINKSLSIVNDGVGTAGVQQPNSGQNTITINAGASDAVHLRGLNIDGLGVGATGIVLNSAGSLTVVNCVARHFANHGIRIAPSSGATSVSISNTIASDNSFNGILFNVTGTGAVKSRIIQTTTDNNGVAGILVIDNGGAGISATIVDSAASNNSNSGFGTYGAGATTRIGRLVATGNGYGVLIDPSSAASSYGDNKINGNTTSDVAGTLAPISMK